MLLNYDFLEFENGKTENRTRDYSLTKAIDKELEAKRLAKLTRPRVKIKGNFVFKRDTRCVW
ncbi:hypothetical protein Taitung21_14870 [Helicobacter pylori]